MLPLVSYIIPAYNCESTINRCIQSIANQTYNNIEIIVINDGSTDNTMKEIIKEVKKNSNIRIITQENKGVSAARNNGIINANGEYIFFVDSDDYISENHCKKMVECMSKNEADLCICGHFLCENDKVIQKRITESEINNKVELYISNTINVPWNKCYRKSIVKDIKFNDKLSSGEDLVFNLECLKKTEKLVFVKEPLYYYFHNNTERKLNKYYISAFGNYLVQLPYIIDYFDKDNSFTDAVLWEYVKKEIIRNAIWTYMATHDPEILNNMLTNSNIRRVFSKKTKGIRCNIYRIGVIYKNITLIKFLLTLDWKLIKVRESIKSRKK